MGGMLDGIRQLHVILGWRGVAARVVVRHDERDGTQLQGRAEDIGSAHVRALEPAAANHASAADAIVSVERGDPKLLVYERSDCRVEEAGDVARAPQTLWASRARSMEASTKLEGCSKTSRRLKGDLSTLRQRDGGQPRERGEVIGRERSPPWVGQTEYKLH
jgi:hypothetical protein